MLWRGAGVTSSSQADPSWPVVTYEQLAWEPRSAGAARRQVRAHSGPYQSALVPQIARLAPPISTALAAVVEEASADIARFDSEVGNDLAPFAAVLLRSESAASSHIENLTASAGSIAEAALFDQSVEGAGHPSNAKQIVANTRAMEAALQLADHLDRNAILTMHDALMSGTDPAIAGMFRNEPVWIGGSSLGPHLALFVPPREQFVEAAIGDLVAFLDRDDIPVLAHAAIAHAQFETIHPFIDGNGRTGRALVHAVLRAKRLTRTLTVPVSAGLLVDVGSYFDALTAYRGGDVEPIIERFAAASFAATENGRHLAADLRAIREDWDSRVKARRDSRTWEIADLLLRQPVINRAVLVEATGMNGGNIYGPLSPLLAADVLVTTKEGRRNQVWRAPEVLRALDDFAARSGRRRSGIRT